MATESSENGETNGEKSYAERTFPNPSDVLGLMVAVQRLHTQILWKMGEVMGDMMAMPLARDRTETTNKSAPLSRCVSDLKDAIDGATEILQQGGRPR